MQRHLSPLAFGLFLCVSACGGKDDAADAVDDTGDAPDDIQTDVDDTPTTTPGDDDDTAVVGDCGDAAPTVTDVTASNGGMVTPPGTSSSFPSLLLTLTASDPDGDLHDLSFELDIDPVIDGVFNPIATSFGAGTTDQAPCSVSALQLQIQVPIDGTALAYDTAYELGIRVVDHAGNMSNTAEFTAITPNQDGSDGDGV